MTEDDGYRIAGTRENAVLVALNQSLPGRFSWAERCDEVFLAEFPCGMAPAAAERVEVCPERIVAVGAHLGDYDFECLLDALIRWAGMTMVDVAARLPHRLVVSRFAENEPVSWLVLFEAAQRAEVPLLDFLRSPSVAI